eukprot:TRINITY_DN3399_c3_g1_i1.p1 TRINITY_DN3399_c3_g1~~TRINITY_DN3399_c3_g1_i1.p1  ORF type:complete len:735 (+),score=99.65 TRINITY_DN3399_c3_g1_i1:65-2269(+)
MGGTHSAPDLKDRIRRLARGENVNSEGAEFWKGVFLSDVELNDVFEQVELRDVRRMRWQQPHHLALLLFKCLEQQRHFLRLKEEERYIALDFRSQKNSLRLLTRLIPLSYEKECPDQLAGECQQISSEFHELFWHNNSMLLESSPTEKFTVLAGEPLSAPLVEVLAETLLSVAFVPNFTVTPPMSRKPAENVPGVGGDVDPLLLWFGGVGPELTPDRQGWEELDRCKLDVLTCMIAASSSSMYGTNPLQRNRFVEALVSPPDVKRLTLAHSLLNAVVSYDPRGSLPYSSHFTSVREPLLLAALHMLVICAEYSARYTEGAADAAEAPERNAFWAVLNGLSSENDMTLVFNSLVVLLRNPVEAHNTWLPGSQRCLECSQEVACLLWKLMDSNAVFRQYTAKVLDVSGLVVPLLNVMERAKTNKAEAGNVQVALWIFMLLSSERDFGVALNKPFPGDAPFVLPIFQGNHVDLLVISFHQLLAVEWLRGLTSGFLTVIVNLSPYVKSLSMLSSVKLLNWFDAMSTRSYLTKTADSWQHAALLLESFESMVQYQYEGSVPLVYAMLRRRDSMDRLFRLVGASSEPPLDGQDVLRTEWAGSIPVHTCSRLLDVLHPEVERFCARGNVQEDEVIAFLSNSTLVGLLPQPHTIMIRSFISTAHIHAYVTTWTWGMIYLQTRAPALFDPRCIWLFPVHCPGEDQPLNPNAGGKAAAAPPTVQTDRQPVAPDAASPQRRVVSM